MLGREANCDIFINAGEDGTDNWELGGRERTRIKVMIRER